MAEVNQEPTFKEQFEEWRQKTYELWVKMKAQGYTQEQLEEMLWGKATLAAWEKANDWIGEKKG